MGAAGVDTATTVAKTLLLVSVMSMGTPMVTQASALFSSLFFQR